MYAVIDNYDEAIVLGICETRADAEELFFEICDEWAYETIMCEDPMDTINESEWNIYEDWRYLMKDASETITIQETFMY